MIAASFIPSVIVMLLQIYLTNTSNDTQTGGIGFGWGTMLHTYTSNMLVSIILAMAFPCAIALMNIKKIMSNNVCILLFCYILMTWFESAVLYFNGKVGFGDFCWAYMIAMYIVWLTAISYLVFQENNIKKKSVGWILLFAHFVPGVLYWMQFSHIIVPLTQEWEMMR